MLLELNILYLPCEILGCLHKIYEPQPYEEREPPQRSDQKKKNVLTKNNLYTIEKSFAIIDTPQDILLLQQITDPSAQSSLLEASSEIRKRRMAHN